MQEIDVICSTKLGEGKIDCVETMKQVRAMNGLKIVKIYNLLSNPKYKEADARHMITDIDIGCQKTGARIIEKIDAYPNAADQCTIM
jgi:hypothetical protein